MTTAYQNKYGLFSAEYVKGDCFVCGKPRLKCAEDLGHPYTEVEVPNNEEEVIV